MHDMQSARVPTTSIADTQSDRSTSAGTGADCVGLCTSCTDRYLEMPQACIGTDRVNFRNSVRGFESGLQL